MPVDTNNADTLTTLKVVTRDNVVEPGQGRARVQQLIAEHRDSLNSRLGLKRTRQIVAPLPIADLKTSVEQWAHDASTRDTSQLAAIRDAAQIIAAEHSG
jgi:hypothetical protein